MVPEKDQKMQSVDQLSKMARAINDEMRPELPMNQPRLLELATTNSSCRLLDLPVEMFEAIMDALPSPDFLTSRLVSKAVNENLLPLVRKRFFARRLHIVSDRSSMEVLHEISKCEHLGKHVRQIKFLNWVLSDQDDLARTSQSHSGRQLEVHNNMKRDEIGFYEYGLHNLLQSTFENFRLLQNQLRISFDSFDDSADELDELSAFWGIESMSRKFPEVSVACTTNARYHVAVYTALLKSGLAPVESQIGDSNDMQLPIDLLAYRPDHVAGQEFIHDYWLSPGYQDPEFLRSLKLYTAGLHSIIFPQQMELRTENLRVLRLNLDTFNELKDHDVISERLDSPFETS